MASGTTIFDVRGVSKHFGGIAALSDVGFRVRAGEVLGLIGPNGAGKATLFECLAGILPVDQGAICVSVEQLGQAVSGLRKPTQHQPLSESADCDRSVIRAPQNFHQYGGLSTHTE